MPDDDATLIVQQPWFFPGLLGLGVLLWLCSVALRRASVARNSPLLVGLLKPIGAIALWMPALVAFNVVMDDLALEGLLDGWLRKAAQVLVIALVTYSAVVGIRRGFQVVRSEYGNMEPEERNRAVIVRKLLTAAAIIAGFLISLGVFGVDAGPLLAGGAIGGVVLGLALQESLSAVFSGILMTWDASLRIGDFVRLESGQEGYIESIGWRNTQLRMLDQTLLVVPNGSMAGMIVTNLSRPSPETAVGLDCGVAYGSDLALVEATALDVARKVSAEFGGEQELKEPSVRWRAFGDSSVDFRVLVPIASQSEIYPARSTLVRMLHDAFAEKGITIPFPQRVVHMASPED